MSEIREISIEYTEDSPTATYCTNISKWINKIYKLDKQNPGNVEIIENPEDNYGYILAHAPKSWLKFQPPKKVVRTEEQKAAAKERLAEARKNKKEKNI